MTRLVDALRTLGLEGKIELNGRWVIFQGERSRVYVVEGRQGSSYLTWCEDPRARTVEWYADAVEAIQAGLRRAAQLPKQNNS